MSSEPQPLEEVYRSSWLALTRLAYLLVGDRGEAEDIVQSVFTTAVTRWEAIDEPAAYLRRAVVNRANDAHRRSFRKAAVVVGASGSIEEPEVDEMWRLVRGLPGATTGRCRVALLRGPRARRHRVAVGAPGEHRPFRSSPGVDDVEEVDGVNDLDDLERELGPALRGSLRRAAAAITGDAAPLLDPDDKLDTRRGGRAEVVVVELGPARRQRRVRRRWMTTAAAAAAVLLIAGAVLVEQTREDDNGAVVPVDSGSTSPTASAPSTMNSPPPEDYPPGLPPEGAVPSTPQTGELVATVARIHDSAWYLYADGRLISTGGDVVRWIERRLTPAGVERVRLEFLSSGLFDPDQPFTEVPPSRLAPFWCTCVRDGGRLLSAAPLPENQFEALEPSRAIARLIEYLKQLVSSAPSDSWVDPQGKEFVASKFAFCISRNIAGETTQGALPDPSNALALLPERAAALLVGRQVTTVSEVLGDAICYEVTTEEARSARWSVLRVRVPVRRHPADPDESRHRHFGAAAGRFAGPVPRLSAKQAKRPVTSTLSGGLERAGREEAAVGTPAAQAQRPERGESAESSVAREEEVRGRTTEPGVDGSVAVVGDPDLALVERDDDGRMAVCSPAEHHGAGATPRGEHERRERRARQQRAVRRAVRHVERSVVRAGEVDPMNEELGEIDPRDRATEGPRCRSRGGGRRRIGRAAR